jgi:hypothetical protein
VQHFSDRIGKKQQKCPIYSVVAVVMIVIFFAHGTMFYSKVLCAYYLLTAKSNMYTLLTIFLFLITSLYSADTFITFKELGSRDEFVVPERIVAQSPLFKDQRESNLENEAESTRIQVQSDTYVSLKNLLYLVDPSCMLSFPINTTFIPDLEPALSFLGYDMDTTGEETKAKLLQCCAKTFFSLLTGEKKSETEEKKTYCYRIVAFFCWIKNFFSIYLYPQRPSVAITPVKVRYTMELKTLLHAFDDDKKIYQCSGDPFHLYIIDQLPVEDMWNEITKKKVGPIDNTPFIKSLLSQIVRIKYEYFMKDAACDWNQYPCWSILDKINNRSNVNASENIKPRTLLESMVLMCDDEDDAVQKHRLTTYLTKLINTVLPSSIEPIVVGTVPSKGLMIFLKNLQTFGTLAYSFSGTVLESNPLQQGICISFIKDKKSMLSIATLVHLSKKSRHLDKDSWYEDHSFYPSDDDIKRKSHLKHQRELILFIQSLQPLEQFSLKAPQDIPYWGWQDPDPSL